MKHASSSYAVSKLRQITHRCCCALAQMLVQDYAIISKSCIILLLHAVKWLWKDNNHLSFSKTTVTCSKACPTLASQTWPCLYDQQHKVPHLRIVWLENAGHASVTLLLSHGRCLGREGGRCGVGFPALLLGQQGLVLWILAGLCRWQTGVGCSLGVLQSG